MTTFWLKITIVTVAFFAVIVWVALWARGTEGDG
jgi:hypothetical protein